MEKSGKIEQTEEYNVYRRKMRDSPHIEKVKSVTIKSQITDSPKMSESLAIYAAT